MALVDKILISAVWVASIVRFTNTSGAPVVSAADNNSGELIADDYTIVFSAVGGGTGTATVATSSPNNPYNSRVVTGVALDGSTASNLVIPGLSLVFNAATANGNSALVHGGINLGVFDSAGADAGVPSDGIQHKVVNDGPGVVSAAIATLLTQAVLYKKTGIVFNYVKSYADGATEKVAGGGSTKTLPYQLKIISTSGAGPSSKTATLQLNTGTPGSPTWVTFGASSILDLTTSTSQDGTGLKANATPYPYRIITGPLTGLEFAISVSCANNDIANVLIFDSQFVQIAPDVTGAPGTWGTADVDLTESGQSTGVITSMGEAFYWVRVLVPSGGGAESNPRPSNVVLEASATVSAGWGD